MYDQREIDTFAEAELMKNSVILLGLFCMGVYSSASLSLVYGTTCMWVLTQTF